MSSILSLAFFTYTVLPRDAAPDTNLPANQWQKDMEVRISIFGVAERTMEDGEFIIPVFGTDPLPAA